MLAGVATRRLPAVAPGPVVVVRETARTLATVALRATIVGAEPARAVRVVAARTLVGVAEGAPGRIAGTAGARRTAAVVATEAAGRIRAAVARPRVPVGPTILAAVALRLGSEAFVAARRAAAVSGAADIAGRRGRSLRALIGVPAPLPAVRRSGGVLAAPARCAGTTMRLRVLR